MFSGHDCNISGHDLMLSGHGHNVPDMIKRTPGTEKTPDTENFTPDTIIHDTLPDPESKSSPPAGRGRTGENRPCPFCLALMLFL